VPGPLPGAVAVWRPRTRRPTARRRQARDGACCLRDGGHQGSLRRHLTQRRESNHLVAQGNSGCIRSIRN